MIKPEWTFRQVEWTDLHPPEDFSFSACRIGHGGMLYQGWVYYPHPETKIRNFQNPSLLELIAEPIEGMKYGEAVEVWLKPGEIRLEQESGR
jgi:hypothetical protein